jgi:hypothetical protein
VSLYVLNGESYVRKGYEVYCELHSQNVPMMKSNGMDRVLNVMSNKERIGIGIIGGEAIYAINI